MTHQILADVVVVAHLLFIMFVVLGGLLVLRWRGWAWVHLTAALWALLIEYAGWYCPLTPLENWLRRRGGTSGYEGAFVERYVLPVVYPTTLTRNLQILLGSGVIAVNVVVYGLVWHRIHEKGVRE